MPVKYIQICTSITLNEKYTYIRVHYSFQTMIKHDHLSVFQRTIFDSASDRGATGYRSSTGFAVCSSKIEKAQLFINFSLAELQSLYLVSAFSSIFFSTLFPNYPMYFLEECRLILHQFPSILELPGHHRSSPPSCRSMCQH